jgi:hypothetical protein
MRTATSRLASLVSLVIAAGFAHVGCASAVDDTESASGEAPIDETEDAISASACLFGRTRQALEASRALTLGPVTRLTAASALDEYQKVELSAGIDGLTTPADVLGFVQDGEIFVRDLTEKASGRVFSYYRYSAGDNPHGFVMAKGTGARVARIGDDSVYECKVSSRAKAQVCLFGQTRYELDEKAGLSFGKETTIRPTTSLSAIRKQQLVLGIGGVVSAKDAVLATDDDLVKVRTIKDKKTGKSYTSYRAHRGDNPMGFVFAQGSLDLVAIDSDESLYQCLVEGPCVPAETAKAHFVGRLDPDSVYYAASSEADGAAYRDPQGRTVRWLAKTAETATKVSYTGGVNDLWAQRFDVSKTTCAVTVTAEH